MLPPASATPPGVRLRWRSPHFLRKPKDAPFLVSDTRSSHNGRKPLSDATIHLRMLGHRRVLRCRWRLGSLSRRGHQRLFRAAVAGVAGDVLLAVGELRVDRAY